MPDLNTFIAFFEQLGLVVVRRIEGERQSVEMALPGPDQVLFEIRAADVARPVIDHIAFSTPDITQTIRDAAVGGHLTPAPPKFLAATGREVSDLTDPWGTRWQFASSAE